MPSMEKYPGQNPNKLTGREKARKFGLALLITSMMLGATGCGDVNAENSSDQPQINTEDTLHPGEQPNVIESESETQEVWQQGDPVFVEISDMKPKEFAAEYGNRYPGYDLASVYNSILMNEQNSGRPLLLTDNYINSYEVVPNDAKGFLSDLGFEKKFLSLDYEICQENSIELFDSYVRVQMNKYMNGIAANNTPEAIAIFDDQFLDYCSSRNSQKGYDEESLDLLNTLKSVVEKYGSTANYNVLPSSIDPYNENVTLFESSKETDKDGLEFSDPITLRIEVNLFNGKDVTSIIEVPGADEYIFSLYIRRGENIDYNTGELINNRTISIEQLIPN